MAQLLNSSTQLTQSEDKASGQPFVCCREKEFEAAFDQEKSLRYRGAFLKTSFFQTIIGEANPSPIHNVCRFSILTARLIFFPHTSSLRRLRPIHGLGITLQVLVVRKGSNVLA